MDRTLVGHPPGPVSDDQETVLPVISTFSIT
jgi:hypothetical protein